MHNNLTTDILKQLASYNNVNCISIILPTHKGGKEVIEGKDKIAFKNELKKARRTLENNNVQEKEIQRYTEPLEELLNDTEFWRKLDTATAFFLSRDGLSWFTFRADVKPFAFVGNHFYLKPLISEAQRHDAFWLLVLSKENAALYNADEHGVSDNYLPGSIELVMEDRPKTVQDRSFFDGPHSKNMVHGQGSAKDNKLAEIDKFFREVNRRVMPAIHGHTEPLIIAADEQHYPIFKDICDYPHIFHTPLTGNYEHANPDDVRQEALKLFMPERKKEINHLKETYSNKLPAFEAENRIEKIIPASFTDKIEVLFLQKDKQIWGRYNPESTKVDVNADRQDGDTDLLNLVATNTLLHGGRVVTLNDEELPEKANELAAIYRY